MDSDNDSDQNGGSPQSRTLRVAAIILIATILVASVVVFFRISVCNQQVTTGGKIVEVCRHFEATDPPAIAAGLVILALLGVFYTEISGFGLSLRRDVVRARDKAERATSVAEDARQAAENAQSTAQVAQNLSLTQSASHTQFTATKLELEQELNKLSEQYNTTRHQMQSGSARTAKMTSIISNMISDLKGVDPSLFDVAGHLNSDDEGQRLAAYAYLYANPDTSYTQKVAETITKDKPFAQYWALRTLRRQVQVDPEALDLNTRRYLEGLSETLGSGTDRAYELRQLLREATT
jgi:hypothetical protein